MSALRTILLGADALGPLGEILAAEGLPTADLTEPGRRFFRVEDDALLGFGGIEGEGAERLLRSLVILPGRRGAGQGAALLAAIENEARALGAARLHLLTTTAAGFFARHGYARADRAAAPSAIAVSAEFSRLCPANATYLVKQLDH